MVPDSQTFVLKAGLLADGSGTAPRIDQAVVVADDVGRGLLAADALPAQRLAPVVRRVHELAREAATLGGARRSLRTRCVFLRAGLAVTGVVLVHVGVVEARLARSAEASGTPPARRTITFLQAKQI